MKANPQSYLNIDRIEFIVTYQCPGSCRHCQNGIFTSRGDAAPCVDSKKAAEAVEKLSRLFGIASVMTFGGEPLLYPEAVCAIHQKAADCGIKTRQLITSGFFSSDRMAIRRVAAMLADAGINSLLISVDAFHQETIPLEPVKWFGAAVKEAGIPGACFYPCWLVDKSHRNPYNNRTKEILGALREVGLPFEDTTVSLTGNAARYLAAYFNSPAEDLSEPCDEPCDEPRNAGSISIAPNGDMMLCGFVIGNCYTEDIVDIMRRYDPYQSPYLSALMNSGPAGLRDCAERNGILADTALCRTRCDVCHAVASKLPCLF